MGSGRRGIAGAVITLVLCVGCVDTFSGTADESPSQSSNHGDEVGPDDGELSSPATAHGDGAAGAAGAIEGIVVDEPEFDHAVTTRDSGDGRTRLIITADATDNSQVDLVHSVLACTVPDGQRWATWQDEEDGSYSCFNPWDLTDDLPATGEPLEMELPPDRYRLAFFGDGDLRFATSPPTVDLEEGRTVELALALQPPHEPRPGPTYRFSLTTDEGWVYNVAVTVPKATGGIEADIYDAPPGRAELIVVASRPHGRISGATPGRNPPPQDAQLQLAMELDLDVTEFGCLPGACDRDGRLSLYDARPEDDIGCTYDGQRLTCSLPGWTLHGNQGLDDDHDMRDQVVGEGDEDVLLELMLDQFMWVEVSVELLFVEAGGPDAECTVELRPDRTIALSDTSGCSIGPPV
jgi:hypothetical protein